MTFKDFSKVKLANTRLVQDGLVKKKSVSTVQLFFLSPKINAQKVSHRFNFL
jgi:hypothetical protein